MKLHLVMLAVGAAALILNAASFCHHVTELPTGGVFPLFSCTLSWLTCLLMVNTMSLAVAGLQYQRAIRRPPPVVWIWHGTEIPPAPFVTVLGGVDRTSGGAAWLVVGRVLTPGDSLLVEGLTRGSSVYIDGVMSDDRLGVLRLTVRGVA